MKFMRCTFLAVLMGGLFGCGFLDSQLSKGPDGTDSKLEQEVKAISPVLGPYGALATALTTLAVGVYGAFHSKKANDNTAADPVVPPKPPA